MARIIWTEPALQDLDDVAEYISLSNFQAAQQLVQKVFDKVERLESHPKSGRKPSELKSFNYREIVVSPCRIFYKIEGEHVYILFVMRQEQDLKKFLLDK